MSDRKKSSEKFYNGSFPTSWSIVYLYEKWGDCFGAIDRWQLVSSNALPQIVTHELDLAIRFAIMDQLP